MLASALPERLGSRSDLTDAREALAYWENRARRLPRHAVRRRREAREMAARWRDRVAAAEREAYGAGILGAILLLAAERRLPQRTSAAARLVARRTAQAVAIVAVAIFALALAGAVALFELLAALLHALT